MGENYLDDCLGFVSNTHHRSVIQRLREGATGKTTAEDLVDRLHEGDSPAATDRRLDRRV